MPREWCTAPAILPVFSSSGASRTSSTSALPFVIRSRACAGVIFGTAAFAVSINCLTLVVIFDSLMDGTPRVVDVSEHETLPTIKSPHGEGLREPPPAAFDHQNCAQINRSTITARAGRSWRKGVIDEPATALAF